MENRFFLIPIILLMMLSGCNNSHENNCSNPYDKNFIPYAIKAFDVYVYNDNTDKEYYAGCVTTTYSQAQNKLNNAQQLAYDFAEKKHLKNWSYICCTVTDASNCVTKVR